LAETRRCQPAGGAVPKPRSHALMNSILGMIRRISLLSWLFFGVGIILIIVLQLIAIEIVYGHNWNWNESSFAKNYFWPLLWIAFLSCLLAPLFTKNQISKKLLLALLTGSLAVAFYYASSLLIFLLYGA
jgi:hypothetical protein